jgi:hypothetical protein
MARTRKSWREKLEDPVAGLLKVCEVPGFEKSLVCTGR